MIYKLSRVKRRTWSGKEKFELASDKIGPVLSKNGNPVTGLTDEDRVSLEKKMFLKENDLAPNSPFWDEYYVLLADKERELDMDNPDDELAIKFLKAHKLVANSLDEAKRIPTKMFVLYQQSEVNRASTLSFRDKGRAHELYNKLSISDMIDVLAVYGVNIKGLHQDDGLGTIEGLLAIEIEKDPKKFISIVEDKSFSTKLLIMKGLAYGVIRKDKARIENSNIYFGGDILGQGLENSAVYLNRPENGGTYLNIKTALEKTIEAALNPINDAIIEGAVVKESLSDAISKSAKKKPSLSKPVDNTESFDSPENGEIIL